MGVATSNSPRSGLATLRQFVRKPREQAELCELCAAPLAPSHQHLLELGKRRVTCACDACAILFGGSAKQRFRRIPRDIRQLRDFVLDDHEWDSLLIPINLAFFVRRVAPSPATADGGTKTTVAAQYPSPGGAMESSLDFEYWNAIVDHNPVLKRLEPEVEALLVNRLSTPAEYYRVPIDQCFRLVGIIRTHWRGLSGGSEVWQHVERFFDELKQASGEPCA